MKLIQTSILSGISTAAKLLAGLIVMKMLALYLGPNGVAIYGQFISLIGIVSVLAGGGIGYGIIKYVAEYADDPEQLKQFLGNASSFTLIFIFIVLCVGVFFQKTISQWIFGSTQYSYLIVTLTVAQLFIAFNLLLNAILNGFKKIKALTLLSVVSTTIGLMLTAGLLLTYHEAGALLALIFSQALPLFFVLGYVWREKWLKCLVCLRLDKKSFNHLSQYSLMNVVSILTVPLAQIIVRNDLSQLFSSHAVGYWQAVLRLSDAYIMTITLALSAYYLPRLAELQNKNLLKQEMVRAYKVIMPVLLVLVCLIYLLRDFIIVVLYSKQFFPARDLFLYQFVGDFFRVAGWLSTYLLLAKMWTKTYIATELILSVLFVIFSHIFARQYGLIGVTYSFALTYFLYWLLMLGTSIFYFYQEKGPCQIRNHSYPL